MSVNFDIFSLLFTFSGHFIYMLNGAFLFLEIRIYASIVDTSL